MRRRCSVRRRGPRRAAEPVPRQVDADLARVARVARPAHHAVAARLSDQLLQSRVCLCADEHERERRAARGAECGLVADQVGMREAQVKCCPARARRGYGCPPRGRRRRARAGRSRRSTYVVSQSPMTSSPVDCTMASNGSPAARPARSRSARSNPSATSLRLISFVSVW